MTERKPHYILGEALIEFHAARNTKKCRKMALGEMFCFSCHAPTKPFGAMVDYIPINDSRGRLTGLCEVCESPVQRFAKLSALPEFAEIYDVAIKSGA